MSFQVAMYGQVETQQSISFCRMPFISEKNAKMHLHIYGRQKHVMRFKKKTTFCEVHNIYIYFSDAVADIRAPIHLFTLYTYVRTIGLMGHKTNEL